MQQQSAPVGNFNYPTSYKIGCGRRRELAAWCESRAHRPSLRSRVARIGRQLRARTLRAMVRAIGIRATWDAATARTLRRWLDRQARKSARALDRARDRATLAQIAIDHPAAW